ncbi:MAG: tRNA (N6-threonylcarbamoyladenosine(37)-N6)-methyltransferase TrmO [Syntrophomonadaceae bacterium]
MITINEASISLQPIGVVRSSIRSLEDVPIPGKPAEIVIYPQYSPALLRIEENSHLWVLQWFHKADRNRLVTVPSRVNPYLPEYGVFGLRAPNRPNPIGLTLVRLEAVDGNVLKVTNLDGIDGTPVLDIKPYFEQDIVCSPATPYIRPYNWAMRRDIFFKQALTHHQEECDDLYMAVRMALVADEHMGQLTLPDVTLQVSGSACLADTLQGLSRARLANPARFAFVPVQGAAQSIWEQPGRRLIVTARQTLTKDSFRELGDQQLFDIKLEDNKQTKD